jgi:hypothetical protein
MVSRGRLHLARGDIVGGVVYEMTGERPAVVGDSLTIGPCAIDPKTHTRLRREFLGTLTPERTRTSDVFVDDWDEATEQLTKGGTLSIWTINEPDDVLFLAWCAFHAMRTGTRYQIVHRALVRYPYALVQPTEPPPLSRESLVVWSELWRAYCEGRIDDVLAAEIPTSERRTLRRPFRDFLPSRRGHRWSLSRVDRMMLAPLATGETMNQAVLVGALFEEAEEDNLDYVGSDWCFRRISDFANCESPWVEVVERHKIWGRWKVRGTPLGLDHLRCGIEDWSVVPPMSACGLNIGGNRPAWCVDDAGDVIKA